MRERTDPQWVNDAPHEAMPAAIQSAAWQSEAAAPQGSRAPAVQPRGLWIAVGALSAAVLALAATLASQHLAGNAGDAAGRADVAGLAPDALVAQNSQRNVPPALSYQAQAAPENVAGSDPGAPRSAAGAMPPVVTAPPGSARGALSAAPRYGQPPSSAVAGYSSGTSSAAAFAQPGPPAPPRYVEQAPRCSACGRVESVQVLQRAVPTTGVGAVAGGVLGAVLGHQIGHGTGRTVATVVGAAGGGYLGNTVEQRTHTRTVYLVRVRMQDGAVRTFERAQSVAIGQPVTVQGHGFRLG